MDIVSALAKISEITTSPNREIDPQELTEIVPKFFEKITEIKLRTCFNCGHHSISKLEKGEQGVYIFLVGDKHYLKVGKVGCNSDARWNSHHYTLNRTASALPLSIKNNPGLLREAFRDNPESLDNFLEILRNIQQLIDKKIKKEKKLTKKQKRPKERRDYSRFDPDKKVRDWIEKNTRRIEFILPVKAPKYAVNFLEGFLQWLLQPLYEGRSKRK